MKYKVENFYINKIDRNKSYVMTVAELIVITDKNLINFLDWVDKNSIKKIEFSDIKKFMLSPTEDAIEFMENKKLISIDEEKKVNYEKDMYISNDLDVINFIKYCSTEDCTMLIKKKNIFNDNEKNNIFVEKNYLYFFILNPFSLEDLEKLVNFAKKKYLQIRVAFVYNFKFYITNIFSPKLGSPCPLCFFYNLETSLRTTDRFTNQISFQNIVDMIYERSGKFTSTVKFNREQLLFIVSYMYQLDNHSYNDVYEIDYNSHNLSEDIAYHWELCDCYE